MFPLLISQLQLEPDFPLYSQRQYAVPTVEYESPPTIEKRISVVVFVVVVVVVVFSLSLCVCVCVCVCVCCQQKAVSGSGAMSDISWTTMSTCPESSWQNND